MRFCKHATVVANSCSDGFSRKVVCEHDHYVKCLRDCIHGCSLYEAVEESLVKKQTIESMTAEQKSKIVNLAQLNPQPATGNKGTSGGGCGGCGSKKQLNTSNRSW